MTPRKVSLHDAFGRVSDHWHPRIVGEVNDAHVKIAKFSGQFDWHTHEREDEMFLVVKGIMRMGLRTGDIDVAAGEMIVVPRGTEHRPEAVGEECHVLMLEPKTTINTGNVVTPRTRTELETI